MPTYYMVYGSKMNFENFRELDNLENFRPVPVIVRCKSSLKLVPFQSRGDWIQKWFACNNLDVNLSMIPFNDMVAKFDLASF